MSAKTKVAVSILGCILLQSVLALYGAPIFFIDVIYFLRIPSYGTYEEAVLIVATASLMMSLACGLLFSPWLRRRPVLYGLAVALPAYLVYFLLGGPRVVNAPGSPSIYPSLSWSVVHMYLTTTGIVPELLGMIVGTISGIGAGRIILRHVLPERCP